MFRIMLKTNLELDKYLLGNIGSDRERTNPFLPLPSPLSPSSISLSLPWP